MTLLVDITKRIYAIGALVLILSAASAAAQTSISALSYSQTSALPPGTSSLAARGDPNGPRWMLLEGYGGDGQLYKRWQLIRPGEFDVTNYHGFHTPSQ